MDPVILGYIGLAVFVLLIVFGMHIAFAGALVGFLGLGIIQGWGGAFSALGFIPYRTVASYELTCIPLFIIMGYFADCAGLTGDLFEAARKWVGHLRGGLAIATMFGAAGFGAVSGSSSAAAAVMGKVAIPEMRKRGYEPNLASGTVAAAGTLAAMIPPSNMMVVYGVVTEQSIGTLLIAGYLPGIMATMIYAIGLYTMFRFNPRLGPNLPAVSWKERILAIKDIWGIILLMSIILVGLYTGVFTPTEAGGVAAFGAFLMALLMRRLTWSKLKQALLDAGKTTSMIYTIFVGVLILLRFLALSGVTDAFAGVFTNLAAPRLVILIGILLLYVFLGMFMSAVGMMMISLPLVLPVIAKLGYDPIWFGIIVVQMSELAFLTPPVAANVFVVKSLTDDLSLEDVFKGTVPLIFMTLIIVAILIAFPDITLFLPHLMRRG